MKNFIYLNLLSVVFIMNTNFGTHSLTIKTDGLENSKGTVLFAVYKKEGSIPDPKLKKYYKIKKATIIDEKSEISFHNLHKGKYAVTVIHDENNNNTLDTKFLLPIPDEGIGFSNYKNFGLSNRPNFQKASFNLQRDTIITVNIVYK